MVELSMMKLLVIIINIVCGGIINEVDLVDVLVNNVIVGVGVDVFSKEFVE